MCFYQGAQRSAAASLSAHRAAPLCLSLRDWRKAGPTSVGHTEATHHEGVAFVHHTRTGAQLRFPARPQEKVGKQVDLALDIAAAGGGGKSGLAVGAPGHARPLGSPSLCFVSLGHDVLTSSAVWPSDDDIGGPAPSSRDASISERKVAHGVDPLVVRLDARGDCLLGQVGLLRGRGGVGPSGDDGAVRTAASPEVVASNTAKSSFQVARPGAANF
jgi:hypothetical protein